MTGKKQKTLLLVEDEPVLAIIEKKELENHGYNVIIAGSGEKAVKMIADGKLKPDLILMDIDLGHGIDGTQAAELILNNQDIPIVFLSSHTESEIVEKTEKITSYGYVVKNTGIIVLDASIKMAFKLFNAKIENAKTEKSLQENEEKFRQLHESAGVGIGYYTIEGMVISYNRIAAQHMNGTPQDFSGRYIQDLFPEDNAGEYLRRIECAARSEEIQEYEDMIELPSGTKWFQSIFTRILDTDKNVMGIQIVSVDITESKQIEIKLAESEKRYRTLFERTANPILIIDTNGNYLNANDAALNFLECSINELKQKNIRDFSVHGKEQLMHEHVASWDSGAILETEYFIGGRVKTLVLTITPGMWCGRTAVFGVGTDITLIKFAETALVEQKNMLRQVLDAIPHPVFWKDRECRYSGCNTAFAADAGIDHPDQVIGKTDFELPWPQGAAEAYRADDIEVMEKKITKRHIIEPGRGPDGSRRVGDTTKVPLVNSSGEIIGILGVFEDITECKCILCADEDIKKS